MIDLAFAIKDVEVERYAVEPVLRFMLNVASGNSSTSIQNVLLSCQLRIEAVRRRYTPREHERLRELFGEAHRWDEALRSMLWTHASLLVPAFESECSVGLPVTCSFDFNVAATKYFYGLEDGEVPLAFLFSGTVFYRDEDGFLQMAPIPWSKEAGYRLPVHLWQEAIALHYPHSAWLRIDKELFDEIYQFKRRRGLTSWEDTFRALLKAQREDAVP